jgi:hypothetical protein
MWEQVGENVGELPMLAGRVYTVERDRMARFVGQSKIWSDAHKTRCKRAILSLFPSCVEVAILKPYRYSLNSTV